MNLISLALATVVAASGAPPDTPADVPQAQEETRPEQAPKVYWLPPVEVLAIDIGLHLHDRYALKRDYAKVTWRTIKENLEAGWSIDGDPLFGNYIGHPYLGATTYNAARSCGYNFWTSVPFVLAGSVLWEYAGETQHPSINDLVNTTIAGSYWGETMHRLSGLLVDNPLHPGWARWVGAALIDPLGSLNRSFVGRSAPYLGARWDARVYAGGLALGSSGAARGQALIGADFDYGFPSTGAVGYVHPFDHFDLRADAGFGGRLTADAFLRGALWGLQGSTENASQAFMIFGLHDYNTGPGFRVADVAVGPGAVFEGRLSETTRLRGTVVGAGIIVGGSGSVEQTDYISPQSVTNPQPQYSTGPGAQGVADFQLKGRAGFVRLIGHSWWIVATQASSGLERVNAANLGGGLNIYRGNMLGAEVSVQQRLPARTNDPTQSGWTGRLTYEFAFSDAL